jgi:hypothetical protein
MNRDSSVNSVVAYKAAGSKHNVVFSDSVLDQVYKNWNSLQECTDSKWAILENAFNMPNESRERHAELQPKIKDVIETEVFKGKQLENLLSASCKILSDSLPDLVTFNSSMVDQMQWERVSSIELTDGTSEAECDFFVLINDFCCSAILPPIAGIQFLESYQLLASDLADLNKQFYALALGLPRLSPVQGLPGAAMAKRRLLQNFRKLFDELSNPPVRRVSDDDESTSEDETDADTTTPLAALNKLLTEHDVPVPAQAAIALEFILDLVSEIVPLVFWTLLHVYSSSTWPLAQAETETPFEKIKNETKSWAQAIQPPSIHPLFPAPPEISFSSTSQAISPKSFPHLRSCINECRRIYNSSATIYRVAKPITLEERSIRPGEQDQWELDVGSYVDVGLSKSLINTSPANHASPAEFKSDRFISATTPASIIAPIDASEPYKTALLVSIIAGIVQLWEITPAPKKTLMEMMIEVRDEVSAGAGPPERQNKPNADEGAKEKKMGVWVVPGARDGSVVKVPQNDVRVRIRRRENLPAPKSPRKR